MRTFEKYATIVSFDDTQKALAIALQDSAGLWLRHEEKTTTLSPDDWNPWKAAVLKEWGKPRDLGARLQDLRKCRPKPKERLKEFFFRFQNVAEDPRSEVRGGFRGCQVRLLL
mmetsp:Transcript_17238/g.44034  ORF Transcript_17238/g.44034 Transcript_17238/m.44034 type:complete len:113 (-) Transcript_17238:109-447(-)